MGAACSSDGMLAMLGLGFNLGLGFGFVVGVVAVLNGEEGSVAALPEAVSTIPASAGRLGLIGLSGVMGFIVGFAFGRSVPIRLTVATGLLIGSTLTSSPLDGCPSNKEMRDVAGGMDLVSGKSGLLLEAEALVEPRLLLLVRLSRDAVTAATRRGGAFAA